MEIEENPIKKGLYKSTTDFQENMIQLVLVYGYEQDRFRFFVQAKKRKSNHENRAKDHFSFINNIFGAQMIFIVISKFNAESFGKTCAHFNQTCEENNSICFLFW